MKAVLGLHNHIVAAFVLILLSCLPVAAQTAKLDELFARLQKADEADAVRMLSRLSGRTHQVYTGFALLYRPENESVTGYEVTQVHFRSLQEWEIRSYVATGSPMDKAGAYGIQDQSALFADRIEGCFYNVVGFPLTRFYLTLLNFNKEHAHE